MTYRRVLPHDLVNEGKLLLNLAHLSWRLKDTPGHSAFLPDSVDEDEMQVEKIESDGSLIIEAISLIVPGPGFEHGLIRHPIDREYRLKLPRDGQGEWPLLAQVTSEWPSPPPVQVFDPHGHLTPEMRKLIGAR